MQNSQAIKIVNECFAYKQLNGELPVSKYDVINKYRTMAFKLLNEIANEQRDEYMIYEDRKPMKIPKRKVTFNEILDYEPTQMGSYGGFTGPVDL